MKTIAKTLTLEEQRARDLARLPKEEAEQHATFSCLLYPRIAYQVDYRTCTPEEVTILSYGFDPTAGATIPTIVVRGKDGRSFRCSIDMVQLTEGDALDLIVNDLQDNIRESQKKLLEDTQLLVSAQLQLDIARERLNKYEHRSVSEPAAD